MADARGAEMVIAIATASVRETDNAAEFTNEIWLRTSVHVEVLSGIEEARLIGLAAQQACAIRGTTQLNVDIGGGSTELSLYHDLNHLQLFSVKLGAVGLTERFLSADPVKPRELKALKDEVRSALERPARELGRERWDQASGTSGTILALGEAVNYARAGMWPASSASSASWEIGFQPLIKFNEGLEKKSVAERAALPGISAQRAEIVIAGGQILEGVMRALNINKVRTCEWALREGAIIDRLRELDAETRPPLPDVSDPRLRGVRAVGVRFGYEKAHAYQVAMLAEKIFDGMAQTFKFKRHHRTLLSAAALLHDVGYHISHEAHHKHSLYLIKHSELTGFSETEKLVIANVARYHRRSMPRERHLDYAALGAPERETVLALSAILRVADGLDRGHESSVKDLKVASDNQDTRLELYAAHDCEKEIWNARQKSELFEQVFKRKLDLTVPAVTKRA
ncbi:MAG: Ppx/GppA phosphatase family protein [Pyrinomonadaceae bacterium]